MAPAYGYEVKEDEEQNKKLLEIIELLVASGYFRARIKGLNSFDKVVGGMIWCISICNFDIDVDLLFQENATIGQKISMTEKIVEVLKEMKCPYHLEPHQIQGLDFIHVFSVIQWLVKKAIESKKGREDYNRSYAVSEFNKIHSFFVDVTKQKKYENALARMVKPQPERKYKRIDGSTLQEENQQIRNTLLEYGRKQYFIEPSSSISSGQEEFKNSEQKVVELFSGLSSACPKQDVVSSDIVGLIVNQKSEEISKIMSSYDDKAKHLKDLSSKSQINVKNSAVLLNKQIDILESNLQSSETQRKILNADLIKAQKGLKVVLEESASLANQIQECEKECEDEKAVAELEHLVTLNDSLKKEESEFKAKCLAKKKKMENLIEQLVLQENVKEEVEKKEEIREELKESLDKLGKLRLILARKNREISALRWKIDDIPSREELHQYQCRFIELHNQVSSKHKETKQFFTLYNSLDDIRLYLDKEVGLLNSVLENFERAMSSESQKAAFMKQFEQIVEGVKQNKLKVERKQQEVKNNKAQLQEKLAEIVEKQRMYFKTVKDFQEECHKNEIIMKKLQELHQ